MNLLGLEFEATECNGWPNLKFLIDDDLIQDFTFNSSHARVNIPLELFNGKHRLDIEHYGKTDANTLVVDDKIIQDRLPTLVNIYIDDVLLPNFVKYKGKYHANGQTYNQALTWGFNGVWSLEFEMPIINWVLRYKYAQNKSAESIVADLYSPDRIKLILNDIDQLEQILQNVKI